MDNWPQLPPILAAQVIATWRRQQAARTGDPDNVKLGPRSFWLRIETRGKYEDRHKGKKADRVKVGNDHIIEIRESVPGGMWPVVWNEMIKSE